MNGNQPNSTNRGILIEIPNWVLLLQCIAFVVLYATWILPHVVALRNIALLVGAVISTYPIYVNRKFFFNKRAYPIWLMLLLFVWAITHFFLVSKNPALQQLELRRIWKYAAIGSIFALGFGISLGGAKEARINSNAWNIFYFALLSPALIYVFKYFLSSYGAHFGLMIPVFLKTYSTADTFYIPKSDYVAFVLPSFAVALGRIKNLTEKDLNQGFLLACKSAWAQYLACGIVILSSLFIFYQQNIKNGMAHAAILMAVFIIWLGVSAAIKAKGRLANIFFCLFILCIFLYAGRVHLQREDSWASFAADMKVAVQIEKYQEWKFAGDAGYPKNENGRRVQISSYERIAWLLAGSSLAANSPLGYGLIEDSFKFMAQDRWPEVSPNLSHSHSGWLDLVLAIGFPGILFILVGLLVAMFRGLQYSPPWGDMIFWALLANLLLWCTTEVSATVTFPALLFWINLALGFTMIGDD